MNKMNPGRTKMNFTLKGVYRISGPGLVKHLCVYLRETQHKHMLKAGCFAKQRNFAECWPIRVYLLSKTHVETFDSPRRQDFYFGLPTLYNHELSASLHV